MRPIKAGLQFRELALSCQKKDLISADVAGREVTLGVGVVQAQVALAGGRVAEAACPHVDIEQRQYLFYLNGWLLFSE